MVDDVSTILMDDTETPPTAGAGTPPKRGRGRPRGSRSRARGASGDGAPADAAGAGTPSPAGVRALASGLAKVIGVASVVVASWALAMPEAAMTPVEAGDIAKPAARLLAKTSIGQWLIRFITGKAMGGDAGKLLWAVTLYGWRIAPLIQLRMQQLELQRQAQKGRPYGTGHTGEDAGVWTAQPTPQAAEPASANGHDRSASERVAADAAQFGGLGFTDPDALAAGAYGDVAANIRAVSQN